MMCSWRLEADGGGWVMMIHMCLHTYRERARVRARERPRERERERENMYVCMCVCMHERENMYVCMHVCMYVCMYVLMYVCMYVCTCVCVFVRVCVCVCVCVCDTYMYTHSGDVEASKKDPSAFERALDLACSRHASTSTSAVSMPHIGPVEDIERRAPGGEAGWGGGGSGGRGGDEEGSSETLELDRQLTEELQRLYENIKRHNITVLMFSNLSIVVE
jgi:hypothetical protein